MSYLSPHASRDEIEEELIFQEVLISSLDPGADGYESRLTEIEATKRILERRLGRMNPSVEAGSPATDVSGDDNGLLHASPAASRTSELAADRDWVSSANASGGTKRPRPHSLSHLQDTPAYKRSTPERSLAGTPSSASSFETISKPNSTGPDRAKQRQMQIEATLSRRREEQLRDEELARRLSQSNSATRPTPGPSGSARPNYQTTLNYNGSFDRPPPASQRKASEEVLSRSAINDPSRSATPAQPSYQYGYQAPSQTRVPQRVATQPLPLPQRTRDTAPVVDLTGGSSDEDVTEIAPSRINVPVNRTPVPVPSYGPPQAQRPYLSNPNPPAYRQTPPQPYTQIPAQGYNINMYHGNMPGAYPMPNSMGHPPGFGFAPSPAPSTQHVPYDPRLPNGGPSFLDSIVNQALAATRGITNRFDELGTLINGSSSRPYELYDDDDDDSDIEYGGYRRLNMPRGLYAGQEDLYRSRYDEIQSHDPQKTKEEINALLDNIRPDEDLPDHLLVRTPEAMNVKLHKYQELGLTWLKNCEEGSNKGGILADDMGLGKTIQMLSLIVERKSDNPACKTTLIVAPLALLRQWKQEIQQRVKPGRHALTVFTHHGASKKHDFQDFRNYDVVLTTFGSLASEVKKMEKFRLRQLNDPDARPYKSENCVFIGDQCKWYRVILDEAQNIKNKGTQTAKGSVMIESTYRWCVTGTPMMNNVDELYSLIKFLRIKPYSQWEKFRMDFTTPLKANVEESRDKAMRMLQTLCKAIMLRRTKKSTFEGKPILVLPERTTEQENAEFGEDQGLLYQNLESRTQGTFNKYLKAGTVMKSYTHILVLLLRLRQACCHPHLIKDFSISATADVSLDHMVDLAKELSDQVVTRLKETEGHFECPVCMDACTNPAIFIPCGHNTCRDCFARIVDANAAIREGNENTENARCPHCRSTIDPKRITDFNSFKRVHMPELLTEEERKEFGMDEAAAAEDSETESEDDSDDEDDDDEGGDDTLGGFIVKDNVEDSSTESEAEEVKNEFDGEEGLAVAGPSKKKKEAKKSDKGKKPKKSAKAKGKKKAKELTLAEMKKAGKRNAAARRKYLRKLRKDFISSSKIDKTMALLNDIMNDPEGERVLIFSQWTSLLDLLEVPVDEKGWGYRRYDGEMTAKMRGDAVDDFKDLKKDVRIMLVSLKAGNAGLNLNIASRVIILDPFWNPYIEEQAVDRAHRLGQTRPVKVHRILVEGTVEDRIINLQEKKRAMIEEALDEAQGKSIGRLGAQELAYLFGVTRSVNDRLPYEERRGAR